MITYNHEAYISQAIGGVLMQETDFPIELVIGDDCSTDRTRQICLEYQQEHPDLIRLLARENNLGISPNFLDTLTNCTGEYIALCEGDDYWTDPKKLQKQIDFLSNNPDFTVCFHNALIVYENEGKASRLSNSKVSEELGFDDIIGRRFFMTVSCVFRNGQFDQLPPSLVVFDWVLHLLNSKNGKIKYLPDVMAVYRKQESGWSNLGQKTKVKELVKAIEACKDYFGEEYAEKFNVTLSGTYAADSLFYFQHGDYEQFEESYKSWKEYSSYVPVRTRAALYLRLLLSKWKSAADGFNSLRSRLRRMKDF